MVGAVLPLEEHASAQTICRQFVGLKPAPPLSNCPVPSALLVGDQPHDGPVFGEHFGSDQDPEHREDLQKKILEHAETHRRTVRR